MTAQSKSFLENTVFAHTLESTPPVKILLFHHPCRRLAARNPPYRGSTGVSRGDGWKASEPVPKPWFSAGFLRQNSEVPLPGCGVWPLGWEANVSNRAVCDLNINQPKKKPEKPGEGFLKQTNGTFDLKILQTCHRRCGRVVKNRSHFPNSHEVKPSMPYVFDGILLYGIGWSLVKTGDAELTDLAMAHTLRCWGSRSTVGWTTILAITQQRSFERAANVG